MRRRFRRSLSLFVRLIAGLITGGLPAGPNTARAAPGELDLQFRGTGWMTAPGPGGIISAAHAMAVQPDGKIVLAGSVRPAPDGSRSLALWRFSSNGLPDPSFNGTGLRIVSFGGAAAESCGLGLALRSDGGLLVAGCFAPLGPQGLVFPNQFLLASFLANGQDDTGFGPGNRGFAESFAEGFASLILVQPDGKILLSGQSTGLHQMLFRYLPDGQMDHTFGFDGIVGLHGLVTDVPTSLALQADGRILVGFNPGTFLILRLLTGGPEDETLGPTGRREIFPSGPEQMHCRKLTVSPGGAILAAGDYEGPAGRGFFVARLTADAELDPSFGEPATPGYTLLPFAGTNSVSCTAMAVQNDGRILVAGTVVTPTTAADLALVRFTAAGRPDNFFGVGGRVRHDLGGSEDTAWAAIQTTGERLLIAGTRTPVTDPGAEALLLARFEIPPWTGLTVEYPAGAALPLTGSVDLGPVTAGIRIVELTLRNETPLTLTNLQAFLTNQSIPGDYHVTAPAAATLAPGAATTVHLSLIPSAAPGVRTAILNITTSAPGVSPRFISVLGSKATPQQIWRVTWFGSPDNSGPGADENDFDHDGLPNFMEYALRTHPHVYTHDPCQPAAPGTFTYTRPTTALTDFSYTPESAPAPAGPWSSANLTSTVLTEDAVSQTVQITAPAPSPQRLFLRLRITKQ